MKMLPRYCDDLMSWLRPGKVLVLFGPRQVGKTTLIKHFLESTTLRYRYDSGDNLMLHPVLDGSDFKGILDYARDYELIVIDEAQRIKGIGSGLKICIDHIPGIRFIVTGSSSFELAGQIGEPLTGRKNTLYLFPLSQSELSDVYNRHDLRTRLEDFLVFGAYPEVLTATGKQESIKVLEELTGSYLFKDVLALEQVKSPKLLVDLLRLLAFQLGSEVSLNELARRLSINYKTVARYLDLLCKAFVIYELRGFSRNLRKEITQKSKYYFWDNGIRNALIANFNKMELREDKGQLWENFLMTERMKTRYYAGIPANPYFWRTWTQQEIDLLEEREGKLFAYEFKWGRRTSRVPSEFNASYPDSPWQVIHPDNYLDFLRPGAGK